MTLTDIRDITVAYVQAHQAMGAPGEGGMCTHRGLRLSCLVSWSRPVGGALRDLSSLLRRA